MIYHKKKFTRDNNTYRDHYYMALDIDKIKRRKKAKRKRPLSAEIRSGYTMLLIAVVVLNLVLGAAFFAINGQKTVLGYKLNQLKLTNDSLQDEGKIIDGKIVETKSFATLEKTAQMRQMVEAGYIEYTVGGTRTARQY